MAGQDAADVPGAPFKGRDQQAVPGSAPTISAGQRTPLSPADQVARMAGGQYIPVNGMPTTARVVMPGNGSHHEPTADELRAARGQGGDGFAAGQNR